MPASSYIKRIREKIGHDALLLPGVTALVFDDKGLVLLQRSRNDGKWHTVGGMAEPGEEPANTVIREVKEECGLDVRPTRVTGVYSWPESRYTNGDICNFVSIAFRCEIIGGELHVADDESLELRFFRLDELPPLLDIEVQVVRHAVAQDGPAWFSTQ